MQSYMGGAAGVPSWMSFGKYAAREAGQQIARLENAQELLSKLDPDAGIDAVQDVINNISELSGPAGQFLVQELKDYVAEQKLLGLAQNGLSGFIEKAQKDLGTLRDALVKGNTEIYANIAPAYDTFLNAEKNGGDGLAALREMGYGNAPNPPDEQNFVYDAMVKYKEAHALEQPIRDLQDRVAAAPEGADRDALQGQLDTLIGQQRQLATDANLRIGAQEQMTILQQPAIFGNPDVQRMVGALGGTMLLHTADGGVFPLLPKGGDWTNFSERMGLREISAADAENDPRALEIRSQGEGEPRYYVPKEPGEREGTIYTLFTDQGDGAAARKLMDGTPPPLPTDLNDGNDVEAAARQPNPIGGPLMARPEDLNGSRVGSFPAIDPRLAGTGL